MTSSSDQRKRRTLTIFAIILATYGLLAIPAFLWPAYADSPAGLLLAIPFLSVYVFHTIGIPGLLEHDGLCGWGWCSPTAFGWLFLIGFWLAAAWVVAWLIASLSRRGSERQVR